MMIHFNQYLPWRTALLSLTVLLLYFMLGEIPAGLIYQRDKLPELWRLFSAHFVHTDSGHLLWNLAGLLLLGVLLERKIGPALLVAVAVGIASVDLLLLIDMRIAAYCGLSGLLNTLLAWLLVIYLTDNSMRLWALLTLIGALLKIVLEINMNSALFTHTVWPAVPLAHLFGFGGGCIIAVLNPTVLKTSTDKLSYIGFSRDF